MDERLAAADYADLPLITGWSNDDGQGLIYAGTAAHGCPHVPCLPAADGSRISLRPNLKGFSVVVSPGLLTIDMMTKHLTNAPNRGF